ncbi:lysozyme inhibitor LprI family protein [Parachitinimonas caeni]|uniref:Lysozyme inhibitor LprI family protein n=1 Tax=Parachitinimonas caeni TaxID=3031301 RepID=A0ABT7DV27_9NEIS|nr:lysozyme inhibitor LprI family protein [Parachitinimonas caeni]MDK2123839.1 lysozyme inhibitor LprI family protein [Parachitinimonas caeni]
MKSALIATLLALASGTTFAAAGCDNPKNDFDDLYCLNKVYLQADKELNENYGKLVKQLDDEGKKLLKKGQLEWIANRNRDCSYKDAKGFYVNLDCAATTTISRAQFLQDRVRECSSAGCMNSKLK